MGLEGEQMKTKNHNSDAEKVLRPINRRAEFPDFRRAPISARPERGVIRSKTIRSNRLVACCFFRGNSAHSGF